ncbi:MAG: hypothetical protein KQH67_01365 [Bacteroidetes bacterium]|nr:hypothetical protein [Bacteroidota bacterium]
MRLHILSSLILFIFMASCTVSEKEQAYIDKIDQLEQSLDSASKQYFAIDTVRLFEAYDLINMNLSRLSSMDILITDSVKMYAFMQKTFKKFIHEHPLIFDELQYSNNQLRTLKKDIRRGRMTEEEMEKYYFEEMEGVSSLRSKMEYNVQHIEHQLQSFEQLNEKVEMIISS